MPAGARIRDNGVFGTTTDNPLLIGSGAFNSAELSDLSIVAGDHAIVTLDPLRQFGDSEIVIITVHTASATVATITRGAYNTLARQHPLGTLWVHAALDEDFTEILTSGTRPLDPYEGQFIYETDTNKLMGFGGTDWAPRDAGGTLGYAQVTGDQSGISGETALTGLSVPVVVGAGRRVRVSAGMSTIQITSAGVQVGRFYEGAVSLGLFIHNSLAINGRIKAHADTIITPSGGAHTYHLALSTSAGTVNVDADPTFPAYILVEDIGAA